MRAGNASICRLSRGLSIDRAQPLPNCSILGTCTRTYALRSQVLQVEAIVGSEKLMKELDRGLEVVKGQIGPDQKLCTVLPGTCSCLSQPCQVCVPPGLAIARIESVCKRIIGGGQFTNFEDFKRYWLLTVRDPSKRSSS